MENKVKLVNEMNIIEFFHLLYHEILYQNLLIYHLYLIIINHLIFILI